jgi:hypothetical protein
VIREQWEADAWEEHCRGLLNIRHAPDIQFIPARDGGDGGLEAYVFSGLGYQCYAPQDSLTIEAQTEAQKRKINNDLKRLCDDPAGTAELLGDIVLDRWILLTPEFDSRKLVEYARKKSQKVRDIVPRPEWVGDDFEIVIVTDADFAHERSIMYGTVDSQLHIEVPALSVAEAFDAVTEGVAERLTQKLSSDRALAADQELLGQCRGELLRSYVRGGSQMKRLRDEYGSAAAVIQRRMDSTLSTLTMTLAASSDTGMPMVATLVRQLAEGFAADSPTLHPLLCEDLAWFAIATWLIECPLRFLEVA